MHGNKPLFLVGLFGCLFFCVAVESSAEERLRRLKEQEFAILRGAAQHGANDSEFERRVRDHLGKQADSIQAKFEGTGIPNESIAAEQEDDENSTEEGLLETKTKRSGCFCWCGLRWCNC